MNVGDHLIDARAQLDGDILLLTARPTVNGDINLDGIVNAQDIAAVASHWLTTGPQGDVNGDGIVNGQDIAVIASNSWRGRQRRSRQRRHRSPRILVNRLARDRRRCVWLPRARVSGEQRSRAQPQAPNKNRCRNKKSGARHICGARDIFDYPTGPRLFLLARIALDRLDHLPRHPVGKGLELGQGRIRRLGLKARFLGHQQADQQAQQARRLSGRRGFHRRLRHRQPRRPAPAPAAACFWTIARPTATSRTAAGRDKTQSAGTTRPPPTNRRARSFAPRRDRRARAAGLSASASTIVCSAWRRERSSSPSDTTTVCSACLRARARSASPWFSTICICTATLVSSVCMLAWPGPR